MYSFKIAYDTKSIFDAIKTEIANFQPNIEYLLEQAKEEKETAQTEAEESLAVYKEVAPTVEGLSTEQLSFISQTIAQAEEKIQNARTASEVEQAVEDYENVMKNFENVRVAKARKVALNTLNSELENASTGLTSVINDAISQINKATTVENYNEISGIDEILTTATTTIKDIKEAQDIVEKSLAIYEESIDETSMTTAYKGIVKNELAKYKQEIDKATDSPAVFDALKNFEQFLQDNKYNSVLKIAEEKILQANKDTLISKLNEYAEYNNEEVKTMVNGYIDQVNEAETIAKIDEIKEGAISALENKIAEIEATLEAQQIAYAAAYKNAITELDEYSKYLESDATLTDEKKKDIKEAIDNTKSNMTRVTTSGEVYSSIKAFRDYINTYYSDLSDKVGELAFVNARNSAIETLNEYASKIGVSEEVKAIITDAIDKMNRITDDDENATADYIQSLLTTTQNNITEQELSELKSEAIKRLTKYVNVASIMEKEKEDNSTDYGENEEQIKKDVQELVKTTMEKVKNATKKAEMPDIDEIIKQITDKLQIKSEQEIINGRRTKVLDNINEYVKLSKETGDNNLESEIQPMVTAIKEATSVEEIDYLEKAFNKYIQEHYSLLEEKKDNIDELSAYLDKENSDKYTDDSVIQNIVKESIQNVKKAKTSGKVQEIVNEANKEREDRETEIKDFVEEKDKMEGVLTGTAITEGDSTVGKNEETQFVLADYVGYDDIVTTMISSYIKEVEKVQYDSIVAKLGEDASKEEIKAEYDKSFEEIIKEALEKVEAYVTQDKDEAKQEVIEYHTPEITAESFYGTNEGSARFSLNAWWTNELSKVEKEEKEKALGEGVLTAIMGRSGEATKIDDATTAKNVQEIVDKTEISIDRKTAEAYLRNITDSKTFKALSDLSQAEFKKKIDVDVNKINTLETHKDIIDTLNSAKVDLGAMITNLQKGEKEIVDTAISTDETGNTGLGSKTYEALQKNIKLNTDGTITGTLIKNNDYTEFSSSNELQSGYYLALKIEKGTANKVNVEKLEKDADSDNWSSTGNKDLDDGVVIIRIPDNCIEGNKIKANSLKIKVKFIDNSNKTIAINEYDLSKLELSQD